MKVSVVQRNQFLKEAIAITQHTAVFFWMLEDTQRANCAAEAMVGLLWCISQDGKHKKWEENQ